LVAASPQLGPLAQLQKAKAHDGTQVQWWDEEKQAYQTSTFDTLEPPGKWTPNLPNLKPGRAVIVKAAQPITISHVATSRNEAR
jgi:hypothetical protein